MKVGKEENYSPSQRDCRTGKAKANTTKPNPAFLLLEFPSCCFRLFSPNSSTDSPLDDETVIGTGDSLEETNRDTIEFDGVYEKLKSVLSTDCLFPFPLSYSGMITSSIELSELADTNTIHPLSHARRCLHSYTQSWNEKGRGKGGGQHGRQRQQKTSGGCPLYREDFPQNAITTVPNAYLNDEWKCRRCNRLVASHASRTDESYGKFLGMIPEHTSPDNMLQLIPLAVRLASRNINGWQRMGSHRDESDSTEVRNPTLSYYNLTRRHCQILGPATPHVVNAHIWPHHNSRNLDLMELQESDIDNPKNILRLHKTIEQNFDQMNIMFEDTGGTTGIRQLRLKILNDDVRTTVLADVEPPKTMGDVDGSPLIFPNGNMPWNHLVGMHAHFALEKARQLKWLPEDQYTHAENQAMNLLAFSLDEGAASRINRWIAST